jgi:hypothetical protein
VRLYVSYILLFVTMCYTLYITAFLLRARPAADLLPHRTTSTNFGLVLLAEYVREDCIEVDELLLQISDYKNDCESIAAETLFRKCSTSWEAYCYLKDRVHDVWLPDSARQQVRQIIKRIQVQLHQRQEYGWAYEPV